MYKRQGYTVAILEVDYKDKNIAMKKAKIIGNTIPVVGFFDRKPNIHEEYVLEGEFIRDSNYGLQFKINSYKRKLIANEEEMCIRDSLKPLKKRFLIF